MRGSGIATSLEGEAQTRMASISEHGTLALQRPGHYPRILLPVLLCVFLAANAPRLFYVVPLHIITL